MPRAEAGTPKHLANRMRRSGLQKLRWFCTPCQKQLPDDNGFKQHCMSESHVRAMAVVGENAKSYIEDYSRQFERDFLQLLRTSHGTKQVHANVFYNQYIADKNHVHQNATKYKSLTEFIHHLGREGICKVEETDKGLHLSWIDNSPEALRRQAAVKAKERQERGDEEREQRLINQQIERAHKLKRERPGDAEPDLEKGLLRSTDGEKIAFSFGRKEPEASAKRTTPPTSEENSHDRAKLQGDGEITTHPATEQVATPPADEAQQPTTVAGTGKISFGMSGAARPKNVFAQHRKDKNSAAKKAFVREPPKKMSEAERIMKEEMEKKRSRIEAGGPRGPGSQKRQRLGL